MRILENFVPPLELCKLIPAGEFEGSALVWINTALIPNVVFDTKKEAIAATVEKLKEVCDE